MLTLYRNIISSDEDQPVVYDLDCGYDDNSCFTVILEKHYYDDFWYREYIIAKVSKEESYLFAKRNKCVMVELPEVISNKFYHNIINPSTYVVEEIFSDVLQYLLSFHVHYNISEKREKM